MAGAEKDLLSFVSAMGGERALRVEENLGEGYFRLRVSEAERRQAKQDVRCVEDAVIELLRNARDAGARHVYVATSREGDLRTTTVLDDGAGIPEDMHERVFESRVTSKLDSVRTDRWGVHGRGMALFSIRENAVSAGVASSVPGGGAAIRVVTDAQRHNPRIALEASHSVPRGLRRRRKRGAQQQRLPERLKKSCQISRATHRGRVPSANPVQPLCNAVYVVPSTL